MKGMSIKHLLEISGNKYARLLINAASDLREECAERGAQEGIPSIEQLASLLASIEQVKVARLSYQVYEDAAKGQAK